MIGPWEIEDRLKLPSDKTRGLLTNIKMYFRSFIRLGVNPEAVEIIWSHDFDFFFYFRGRPNGGGSGFFYRN